MDWAHARRLSKRAYFLTHDNKEFSMTETRELHGQCLCGKVSLTTEVQLRELEVGNEISFRLAD